MRKKLPVIIRTSVISENRSSDGFTLTRRNPLQKYLLSALLLMLSALPFYTLAQNPISIENGLTGNPSTEWDITGAGDLTIQGFATQISVNKGQRVDFKIKSPSAYTVDIYRLGWYGGSGARKVSTSNPVVFDAALPQTQPADLYDGTTGRVHCENWAVSAHWDVPIGAVSGVYIAKLTKTVGGGSSHIAFIVRDDFGSSPMLFKTSDATWQAYNGYGGSSLYVGTTPGFPQGHATKVSYDRPFTTRDGGGGGGPSEDWIFNAEYPMIRWLERNGYHVSYTTDVDMDIDPIGITPTGAGGTYNHKIFISVGHDEYWSAAQRTKIENARNAGVHLAFFSGNEVYWKTRWEDAGRTLVCYKEGTIGENVCGTGCDPSPIWTGLWRDGNPINYPGSDGFKPENALTGQMSWAEGTTSITVPDTYKNLRFWRNTTIATLPPGGIATLPNGTLGYEWDYEQPQFTSTNPAGRIILSNTDFASRTHKLSLYRHSSGALVFGAGTVQWSWGLDGTHDRGNAAPSLDMQQATVNLFADMGVQPFTPHALLVAAAASTDLTKPVSIISFPLNGGTLSQNTTYTINGTSSDAGGGVLAGVEVSTDGGLTWQLANGTTNWSIIWTPTVTGSVTIKVRGFDDSGNLEDAVNAGNTITVTVSSAPFICPCNLFQTNLPITPPTDGNDGSPITVGVKFRSTTNGFITGVRFYKGLANTGVHVGQLWSSTGVLLANATFTNETTSGWQQVDFGAPVAITAGTVYVAAYRSPTGAYSATDGFFATSNYINGPLESLQDGVSGGNGVYRYSPVSVFPDLTFGSSNYWVDAIFNTTIPPDVTPPLIVSVSPVNNSSSVAITAAISATFNEPLDISTINGSSVFLRDAGNNLVPATVSYNAGLQTIVLTPSSPLSHVTQYTATIKGGTGYDRIKDVAGNALAVDYTWTFTTVPPPIPPPLDGLGGPILVISSTTNKFSRYTVEILRAEGINSFDAKDISEVNATNINGYDVIVLGQFDVSPANVTMLTTWVNAGGTLIAFKPDADLNTLMGINAASGTLAEGYISVNTGSGPGVGITSSTIQYHGIANLHALNGATTVATLYSNANTATPNPAVTQNLVGPNGGKAYAFTYDLASSIVYTRQGNPAWSGTERDGRPGPIRSNDLFFGASSSDPQPDYVDFNKIQIPQADEQQRLLSNIITLGNLHRKPLPKFWFLPRKLKAAIVMTGDDHANGGTKARFNQYLAFGNNTPQDVEDWRAIRGTSYIYSSTDNAGTITNAQVAAYEAQGFEIAIHLTTNCLNWTSQSNLEGLFDPQILEFASKWPDAPPPSTNRTHCIAWSDWATQAKVESSRGIRLDVNYYYWPDTWVQDRPGLFTGSGMPMRFADLDGGLIDCYQVTTQLPDEASLSLATHVATLLDNAIGSLGYYGVFTTNMHTDFTTPGDPSQIGSEAIVAAAQARNIPVISARQLLKWLDGRNASNFENMVWSTTNNTLSFDISVFFGAFKLQAMVPVKAATGTLSGITFNGSPVSYTIENIKGIQYAFFTAQNGSYVASYFQDVVPPVITNVVATPNTDGTVTITWTTNEPSTSVVNYGLVANNLNQNFTDNNNLVTSHSVILTGLNAGTTYYFRVTSADLENNSSTLPVPPATQSFVTSSAICVSDNAEFDFLGGTTGANTKVVIDGNGALILTPFLNEEFSSSNPSGFTVAPWAVGGTTNFVGGIAILENSHIFGNAQTFGPGSSIEFTANFSNGQFQNIGFSLDGNFNAPWVAISRGAALVGDNSVYLRMDDGTSVSLGSALTNAPHRYKINWNTANFEVFVDGVSIAPIARTVGGTMIPHVSDASPDGQLLSIDWMRLSPYASPTGSGIFTSRVIDGGTVKNWDKVLWTSIEPVNSGIAMEIRTGNTPAVDVSWTGFQARTNGSQVGLTSRYVQYRATLSTANLQNTPVLQDISFSCLAAFPVKLVNFRASAINKDVKLDWATASESNNRGFEIQRSLDGRTWVTVGYVPGAGNSNTLMNYTYTDKNLQGGRYLYRLKQVDFDGQYNYSGVINISISDNMGYSLGQNHPNPFNGTTIIPYSISATAQVRITIYDVHGRTIKVINEGQRRAGQYNVQVDLGDLRKGVYYYKMDADNFMTTRKMIVQ